MKTPKWFLKRGIVAILLLPLSWFYLIASKTVFTFRKLHVYKSRRPIVCFGNILSGGVGKTPMVREVAKFFDAPVVMRGYKKSAETGDVGDEAKMLSNDGILVHVGNRKSNLVLLNKQKSNTPIIMDDGFQNFALPTDIPIFTAKNSESCPFDKKTNVIAFAGIGYPKKFFDNIPCKVVEKISFPDHYQYSDEDVNSLIKKSKKKNAVLLTTEKDWVRLPDWAKKQIKFSALNTEIEKSFYDWIKGKVNEYTNKRN